MTRPESPPIDLLHIWIRQLSPMVWRRVLVCDESTLAQLRIHGRDFSVCRPGGPWFARDPGQIRLVDLRFRRNERFLYEYDFGDS